jgi:hypothetical protein
MSCDTSIYHTTVDLDRCLSPRLDPDDCATASETDLERDRSVKPGRFGLAADQSKSKAHRHEAQSRIIPDSTQTEPEYVWGDEGPIND